MALFSASLRLTSSRLLMNECFRYLSPQRKERGRKMEKARKRRQLRILLSLRQAKRSAMALDSSPPTMERTHLYSSYNSFTFLAFVSPTCICKDRYTKGFPDFLAPVLLFHLSFSLPLPIPHLFPERLVHHHLPAELNPLSVYSPLHEWLLCWHDCMGHTHTHAITPARSRTSFAHSLWKGELKNKSAGNITWCVDTTPDPDKWGFYLWGLRDTLKIIQPWTMLASVAVCVCKWARSNILKNMHCLPDWRQSCWRFVNTRLKWQ